MPDFSNEVFGAAEDDSIVINWSPPLPAALVEVRLCSFVIGLLGGARSGGHINPAVTFGLFLARKATPPRALFYIIAQCLGAICGARVVKGWQASFYENNGGGANHSTTSALFGRSTHM
ncbi:unnamed protein product [Calypogeia fissa]